MADYYETDRSDLDRMDALFDREEAEARRNRTHLFVAMAMFRLANPGPGSFGFLDQENLRGIRVGCYICSGQNPNVPCPGREIFEE